MGSQLSCEFGSISPDHWCTGERYGQFGGSGLCAGRGLFGATTVAVVAAPSPAHATEAKRGQEEGEPSSYQWRLRSGSGAAGVIGSGGGERRRRCVGTMGALASYGRTCGLTAAVRGTKAKQAGISLRRVLAMHEE